MAVVFARRHFNCHTRCRLFAYAEGGREGGKGEEEEEGNGSTQLLSYIMIVFNTVEGWGVLGALGVYSSMCSERRDVWKTDCCCMHVAGDWPESWDFGGLR